MPILLLGWVIQIFMIIHVIRTGRPTWWIWILFAAPFIGGIAYTLLELLPGSHAERKVNRIGRDLIKSINPDLDLRKRAQELEICGSVDNKRRMAEECIARGMPQDAVSLYQSSLHGPYLNDPNLIYGLARAQFANADYAAASELLTRLRSVHPKFQTEDILLLQARTTAACGETAVARSQFEEVISIYTGLEAAYQYADFLLTQGHSTQASQVLNELILKAKIFKIKHEDEIYWLKQARMRLKTIDAS